MHNSVDALLKRLAQLGAKLHGVGMEPQALRVKYTIEFRDQGGTRSKPVALSWRTKMKDLRNAHEISVECNLEGNKAARTRTATTAARGPYDEAEPDSAAAESHALLD